MNNTSTKGTRRSQFVAFAWRSRDQNKEREEKLEEKDKGFTLTRLIPGD